MKFTIILSFLIIFSIELLAQDKKDAKPDIMRSSVSPATNLLGLSTSDITRPTDVKALMISLHNATQNFTVIPSSFAIDIAPFWLGKKTDSLALKLNDEKVGRKSLVISLAVKNLQSTQKVDSTRQLALGFRIALKNGKYEQAIVTNFLNKNQNVINLQKRVLSDLQLDSLSIIFNEMKRNKTNESSSDYLEKINWLETLITDNYSGNIIMHQRQFMQEETLAKTELLNSNKKIVRSGFKIDLAGGISYDFLANKYSNGRSLKSGIWLTAGQEFKDGHSILGMARYLFEPEKEYLDAEKTLRKQSVGYFDSGLKYNFQQNDNPLSIGAEIVFRKSFESTFKSGIKTVFNLNYDLGSNTVLSLAIGRDFDNTMSKDGNLISVLNFIKGFGN